MTAAGDSTKIACVCGSSRPIAVRRRKSSRQSMPRRRFGSKEPMTVRSRRCRTATSRCSRATMPSRAAAWCIGRRRCRVPALLVCCSALNCPRPRRRLSLAAPTEPGLRSRSLDRRRLFYCYVIYCDYHRVRPRRPCPVLADESCRNLGERHAREVTVKRYGRPALHARVRFRGPALSRLLTAMPSCWRSSRP